MRIPTLLTRLRGLFRPGRVASEIDEEMGLHVTMRAHDLERGGMAPGEARRAAARRFGNVPLLRDHGLDVRGGGLPGTLVQDVRFGVRLLRRQPVSSLLAVATLAVGIGMSTMLFSVVDVALLRPLPYPDPEELVLLSIEEHEIDGDVQRTDPSIRDVRGWRDAPHVLAAVGIGSDYALRRVVDAPAFEAAERVPVGEACEGFIEVLGIAPLLGRAINAEDCRLGAPAVALLGEAYWRRQFGASPDIIGRSVQLAGTSATIVGVLPAGLQPEAAVWSPPAFQANESNWDVRRGMGLTVRARLAPGVTAAQAARELTELTARLGDDDGSRPAGRVYVQSMHEEAVAGSAASLSVLGGAVALILLIACVNVAGLLLARGVTRQSELAIRVSIGASRARLVRQLVTECLMLGGLGAVAGLALAAISLDAFVSLVPLALPENSPLGLGVTVVAAAVALGMTSAVAAGVVPALRLSRVRPGVDLASASRLHGAALSRRGGKCLIAVEVALAIVLLAGAGVLVQSFVRLVSVDLGFDPDGIVTMEVQLASAEPDVGGLYYTELLDRLRALPDVESASGAWGMLGDMAAITFGVPGLVRPGEFDTVTPVDLFQYMVLPGFFETLGADITLGRALNADDLGRGVAVINEAARRRMFPDGSPVGRSLTMTGGSAWQVVGVVSDLRTLGPARRAEPQLYLPTAGVLQAPTPLTVVVRPGARPGRLAEQLRDAALSIGPRVVVERIRTGRAWLGDRVAIDRQRAQLLGLLGGTGLLLELVGIFSVTAYAVARRTQEVGVRMAFGARPGQVVGGMVRDAAWPVGLGLTAGLAVALSTTRLVSRFLFETSATDPMAFAAVALTVGASACLAAWLPARRAARIDPVTALRDE